MSGRRPGGPSRDAVLALLAEVAYRPLTARGLLTALGAERGRARELRALLQDLEREGAIERLRGETWRLPRTRSLRTGRLHVHRDGYGFVEPEGGDEPDIYVRRRHMAGALHRDRVRVQVTTSGGRAEGRVQSVLERAAFRISGVLRAAAGGGLEAVPLGVAPYAAIRVPSRAAAGAAAGMVVGVELLRHEEGEPIPEGRVVETLGWLEEPGMDMRLVIRKHGLRDEFPEAVRSAARASAVAPGPEALAGREDYRTLTTVTIDGETARDFDDAISIARQSGGWRLWVHIADVAHYVPEGSAVDLEARARSTSVYFPERAIHMLPEELSTGVCSLRPDEDRLVQTCVIDFDASGSVTASRLSPGVIRSRRRLTYSAVHRCLTGDAAARAEHADLVEDFRTMEELAGRLHARRRARGSIDFDLPEPVIQLDEAGVMTGILPQERNVAHGIIEEFMLAANEAVAAQLIENDWPGLFRIHEQPDPRRLEELDTVLRTFGYSLPEPLDAVTPMDIQAFLRLLRGRPEESALQRIVLQALMRARYSAAPGLHFGLATRRYLHFTSPIRRYPDLVVHRTVAAASAWRGAGAEERRARRAVLHAWAADCSERERAAQEAEYELIAWKKIGFMSDRVGEEYGAIVSGVVSFGLFVVLEDLYIDGLVHVSTLDDDNYRFVEKRHMLLGDRTGRRFRLGDRVRVVVQRVDALAKRIDFRLVDAATRPPAAGAVVD